MQDSNIELSKDAPENANAAEKREGVLGPGKKPSHTHFILVSKSTFRHQALAELSMGKKSIKSLSGTCRSTDKDKPNSNKPTPQQTAKRLSVVQFYWLQILRL
ncbi:hypothetical protein OIU76_009111 [Salix suchowensis]|nr:hypothetical protein OIU76_009111 [Salix suchowensis]KAJ6361799.1 hypothetical protein OIU78_002251 [Salix suchowensis]